MNAEPQPESTDTDEKVNLFDALHDLGAALPESARPSPNAQGNIVAGLVRYIDTGSLELPAPDERPDDATVAAQTAENSRIAELEGQLTELRQQNAVAGTGPSPVAPAPTSPAPSPSEAPGSLAPSGDGGAWETPGTPAPNQAPPATAPATPDTEAGEVADPTAPGGPVDGPAEPGQPSPLPPEQKRGV